MTDKSYRSAWRAAQEAYPLPARLAAMLEDLPLGRLAFAPVPVQARRDGWTPARQVAFIHRLALCGDVALSARGVGMSRESAWRLRKRPGAEGFAAAWDEAAGWGADRLADLGLERSLAGEVRDVYYRGRKVGERVCFNNSLLIAVLNRFPPDLPRWPRARIATPPSTAPSPRWGPERCRWNHRIFFPVPRDARDFCAGIKGSRWQVSCSSASPPRPARSRDPFADWPRPVENGQREE